MAANYYDTLGVSKSATAEEIKKAYRKLALEWHPDRHPNDKEAAEKKFKEINEAYQVLSNPQKKQMFDAGADPNARGGGNPFAGGNPFGGNGSYSYTYSTADGQNPFGDFGDPFDIFSQFFGGGNPFGGRQAAKPRYSLTIDFMEAMKGVSRNVEIDGKKRTIKIPAGVNNGNTIDFRDFRVTVNVKPHEMFERDGDDILVNVKIPFSMAILGGEIKVPTIEKEIKIKIRNGTQAGTMMRLHGEGAPRISGRGRGDEYIKINIETPSRLTREQKQIVEEMKREGL
ncbi:MAG TPA: DnaJ C-terminal domain-containing protein [Patescibacteria group bacterium]|nr:DnaJ C-terminal domain-containing protein [Patescibacteria group bacterium]